MANTQSFRIVLVGGESIMSAAMVAAHRTSELGSAISPADVAKATGLGNQQASNALAMGVELNLLREVGPQSYLYRGRRELRVAPKQALPTFFREVLQAHPPFLLYVSYLSRGFDSDESARFTAAAFDLGLAPARIERQLQQWGRFAGIIKPDGGLDFTPKELLEFGFLPRLTDALRTDMSLKTFVIQEIGPSNSASLYKDGVAVDGLARALGKAEAEPRDALRETGEVLEAALAVLARQGSGPQSEIGKIADHLSGAAQQVILRVHRNLCYGVAGFRNAADHGSDPVTGNPWSVTSEAALVGSLLGLLTIRSIARFTSDGTQEL